MSWWVLEKFNVQKEQQQLKETLKRVRPEITWDVIMDPLTDIFIIRFEDKNGTKGEINLGLYSLMHYWCPLLKYILEEVDKQLFNPSIKGEITCN